MTLPVRFYTSVAYYVGPDDERTPMWQGYATVMGQRIAEVFECHGIRTETAILTRLTNEVRDIHRRHLNP